jgi:hypothetical protein
MSENKCGNAQMIGDLVLGFNSLLVDVYRAGMTAQAAERVQVEIDHRKETSNYPRVPIVGAKS